MTRDHHFNTVTPRKSRTRKLFVVAWYCIPVQALTRTHQTARNTEMHGVCYWYLRVGCLFYLIEILIIWKLNSCSIDFTQNMEEKLKSREVKHKVHRRFVIFFHVYISCSLTISKRWAKHEKLKQIINFQVLGFLKIYRLPYLKEKTNHENRFKTTAVKKSLTSGKFRLMGSVGWENADVKGLTDHHKTIIFPRYELDQFFQCLNHAI